MLCKYFISIFISQEWTAFASLLNPVSLLQKSFVEKCVGQAVGGVVKRKKVKEQLVMRDDASLTKFCDAFRLIIHALLQINPTTCDRSASEPHTVVMHNDMCG